MDPAKYIRKYARELGSTSEGVPISKRILGAAIRPTAVSTAAHKRPKLIVVCIALRKVLRLRAPKYLAITTPAPIEMPWNSPTIKKIRLPEELTEERAMFHKKLPTINESAVL